MWERRVIRSIDPDSAARPILCILFGCAGEGMDLDSLAINYLAPEGPFDRLMVDHYAAKAGQPDGPSLSMNRAEPVGSRLALAWKCAPAFQTRRWVAVLQGFNIEDPDPAFDPWAVPAPGTRKPDGSSRPADSVSSNFRVSRASLEYKSISALAAGAQGILFYGGFPRDAATRTGAPYATAGFRKRAVGPVIRLLGTSPFAGVPSPIEALAREHGGDTSKPPALVRSESDSLHWRFVRSGADGRSWWLVAAADQVRPARLTVQAAGGACRLRVWDGTRGPAISPRLSAGSEVNLEIPGLTGRIFLIQRVP
jgi:hypothetical protein